MTRMRPILVLTIVCSAVIAWVASSAQAQTTSVTVIHGINGTDLGLDESLPVDVHVSGVGCALTGFVFRQISDRLAVPPGDHDIEVRLAADDVAPCEGATAISAPAVPFAAGERATVVAHLSEGGGVQASKFTNDLSAAERDWKGRASVHHLAAAPAVDITVWRQSYWWFTRVLALFGVVNGDAADAELWRGDYVVKIAPAGEPRSSTPISRSYKARRLASTPSAVRRTAPSLSLSIAKRWIAESSPRVGADPPRAHPFPLTRWVHHPPRSGVGDVVIAVRAGTPDAAHANPDSGLAPRAGIAESRSAAITWRDCAGRGARGGSEHPLRRRSAAGGSRPDLARLRRRDGFSLPIQRRAAMRGLKGKNVLVTGGASGIGQATATRFLEEGCSVCVLDCSAEALARVTAELPALAGALEADVCNREQVEAALGEAIERMGSVDVLINNAGISIRHDFLDITPEEWDQVLGVNLTGAFHVAQMAARHMVSRGSGVILNTASTLGHTGYPHYADYSASKGGLIALTLAMALELAPSVRVNAISPGYVLTPMQRAEYSDAMLDAVNRKIPLGRHASPEEIGALFAYLASEDAGFVNGQVYVIDGAETTGGLCSQWAHE